MKDSQYYSLMMLGQAILAVMLSGVFSALMMALVVWSYVLMERAIKQEQLASKLKEESL